jgi:hypothetical protein
MMARKRIRGAVVVDLSRDNRKEGDDPRSRDGLEQQSWPGAEMEMVACLSRDGEEDWNRDRDINEEEDLRRDGNEEDPSGLEQR